MSTTTNQACIETEALRCSMYGFKEHPGEKDKEILRRRAERFDARRGPKVGEWILFTDGVMERISYRWPGGFQTSDGGRFYLDDDYARYSGSLNETVPSKHIHPTDEMKRARFWFFHDDWWGADRGIDVSFPARVWEADVASDNRKGDTSNAN